MHNPIINTLNQHVRFRSMTLRRVLRNRRISTLSLYVSNTLMLVYKGDIKTKRGKCKSMVVFRMGKLCAACHVCRSGIRVNWTNPHLKIKTTNHITANLDNPIIGNICRSASHFLFPTASRGMIPIWVCVPHGFLTSTCHQGFTWVDSQTFTQTWQTEVVGLFLPPRKGWVQRLLGGRAKIS